MRIHLKKAAAEKAAAEKMAAGKMAVGEAADEKVGWLLMEAFIVILILAVCTCFCYFRSLIVQFQLFLYTVRSLFVNFSCIVCTFHALSILFVHFVYTFCTLFVYLFSYFSYTFHTVRTLFVHFPYTQRSDISETCFGQKKGACGRILGRKQLMISKNVFCPPSPKTKNEKKRRLWQDPRPLKACNIDMNVYKSVQNVSKCIKLSKNIQIHVHKLGRHKRL